MGINREDENQVLDVNVIAAAIANSQAGDRNYWGLSISDDIRNEYRRMAQVVIDVMSEQFDIIPKGVLNHEWGMQITEDGKTVIETHPGMGEPLTREAAFYENERWNSYGYNTKGVMFRLTTKWKRVET